MIVEGYEGLSVGWIRQRRIQGDLSNICNLNCPGCARQKYFQFNSNNELEAIESYKKQSIPFDNLKLLLSSDINIINFNLSLSDVLYYPNFLDVINYLNNLNKKPNLVIATNGSGRKIDWWKKLGEKLNNWKGVDYNEEVLFDFAIDGLEDTNHIYRVNSNWQSIIDGINTLNNFSKIRKHWRYIVFSHNYHQIQEAYQLAKKLKFDKFILIECAKRTPINMKISEEQWQIAVNNFSIAKETYGNLS